MLDPITIGIFAVLAVVVAVFVYFAKYGEDDSNFDKAYKDAALNLLSEQKEKKQNKSKPNKNKKDKKNEKKDDKADDSPVEKESPAPMKSESNHPKKENKKSEAALESDKENQTVPQDPEIDVVEAPTAVPEPIVEEKKTNKKTKLQPKKETVAEKNELIEDVVAVKKAPVVQKEKEPKKPKQKKRVPVPTDLDQHKLLGRLANIEEIEPEYIEYISQYFIDATDKENALSNNVLALEKSAYELRQKAEQHCAARITAEREMQDNQRALNELNKRVAQLEKIGQADVALIAELKAQVAENAQRSITNTTLDTELAQAELEKQTVITSLKAAENDINSITKEKENLIDELKKVKQETSTLTKQLAENEEELKTRTDELNLARTDYAELEVLVRKLKSDLEAKRREVLVSAAEVNNEKSAIIGNWDAKVKELEKKEQQLIERETGFMIENKRLAALVEELQKEIVKFEQFKAEQAVLQVKLEQQEKELAEKTKQIQEQEIIVSSEESLKIENSALKSKAAELTALLNEATKEKNEALAKAKAAESASANEEVIVLKKSVTLDAAPSSSEVDELKKENKYLNEKNEELRKRNFKILDDVVALEKRILASNSNQQPGPANPVPAEKKNIADHSKALDEERNLVVSTLSTITDLPKLSSKDFDAKKYASWLKAVTTVLKAKISETESRSSNDSESAEELQKYRTAFIALKSELSNIESAWSVQADSYEKKIASLEKKLNKTQISNLKDTLSPVSSPSKKREHSKRRETGDSAESEEWEVVN